MFYAINMKPIQISIFDPTNNTLSCQPLFWTQTAENILPFLARFYFESFGSTHLSTPLLHIRIISPSIGYLIHLSFRTFLALYFTSPQDILSVIQYVAAQGNAKSVSQPEYIHILCFFVQPEHNQRSFLELLVVRSI